MTPRDQARRMFADKFLDGQMPLQWDLDLYLAHLNAHGYYVHVAVEPSRAGGLKTASVSKYVGIPGGSRYAEAEVECARSPTEHLVLYAALRAAGLEPPVGLVDESAEVEYSTT